jgi:hypothetical protein
MLTMEAEVNGDSTRTNDRGPSLFVLGLSCQYKRFLFCLGCSSLPSTKYFFLTVHHRLNMEIDLQSLYGLHVHSCTHWLRPRNPPYPPPPPGIWAHIRGRYWSAKIDDISLWPPAVHHFNSFVPIAEQAGQAAVLGRLSLSMCLW